MKNHYQWIESDQFELPELPEYCDLPILPGVVMQPSYYVPPIEEPEMPESPEQISPDLPSWNLIYLNAKIKVPVWKSPFLIGADEDNDFILSEDPTISRKHASLLVTEEGIILEDLHSSNHIFIGPDQLQGKILLKSQAKFTLSRNRNFKVERRINHE